MVKKLFYLILAILIVLIFYKYTIYFEPFDNFKKCVYFQHNKKTIVTKESYKYVSNVKQQLLNNIVKLLNKLNIKYVLSHGNLIEIIRKKKIYHDDDIDIRMDIDDLNKWKNYCYNLNSLYDYEFNLKYDSRIFNINKQKYNGIQVWLIKFNNKNNIKEFNMDIHCDLVFNKVGYNKFWHDYNIDFNNRKKIKFLDVNTHIPSDNDTKKMLEYGYGANYMVPNYKLYNLDQCSIK